MSFKPIELRKIRKPLMEKKRRARINDSLDTLKQILLQNTVAIPTSGGRIAKLEKADILEMTVRYVQNLHRRLGMPIVPDSVSSTTQEAVENSSNEANKEIYKHLLKELNRPNTFKGISRERTPRKLDFENMINRLPNYENSCENDKENCIPENYTIFKRQISRSKSENKNEFHWRPW